MKVSLIITTYNWTEALSVVLKSVETQRVLPYEVIIADDGSKEDTRKCIENLQNKFPIPLIHSWQEDLGFRAAKSRNKAVAKASGDYIVFIDGDIVLHHNFIKDHIRVARKNYFIQGGRAKLTQKRSAVVLLKKSLPSFFSSGIKNRKNTISNVFLSAIFSRTWNDDASTRSCNFAVWKNDLLAVNGFNEEFEGWGREDSELVIRLFNLGIRRYYLKFSGIGYHLHHEENTRESLKSNDQILQATINEKLIRCLNGLDQYVIESSETNSDKG